MTLACKLGSTGPGLPQALSGKSTTLTLGFLICKVQIVTYKHYFLCLPPAPLLGLNAKAFHNLERAWNGRHFYYW